MPLGGRKDFPARVLLSRLGTLSAGSNRDHGTNPAKVLEANSPGSMSVIAVLRQLRIVASRRTQTVRLRAWPLQRSRKCRG